MVSSFGRSVGSWLSQLLQDRAAKRSQSSASPSHPTSETGDLKSTGRRHPTALEKRVCYSGSPLLELTPTSSEPVEAFPQLDSHQARENTDLATMDREGIEQSDGRGLEVVFIDESVDQREDVELALETRFGGRALIYTIDRSRDGIDQITDTLKHLEDVDAVHIVSHGSGGSVQLGNSQLTQDRLDGYAGSVAAWGGALNHGADVLFYGCDLASTESGRTLLESVRELVGADIAASDDLTGHAGLGGDWDLELKLGEIETEIAFDTVFQADWHQLLATVNVTTHNDVLDGNVSSVAALISNRGADGAISLREAIIATNNSYGRDTIYLSAGTFNMTLPPGLYGYQLGYDGDFDINDDLTITGAGMAATTIDAASVDRVFEVFSGTVTLQDMTLANGSTGNLGGGLHVLGSADVSLTSVTVRDSIAGVGGGIHVAQYGQLTLRNALIADNQTTLGNGGGLANIGGTVDIDNSVFRGNLSRKGGAIQTNTMGQLTLTDVTLDNNSASVSGGGLHALESTATLTRVNVTNNRAVHGGGLAVDDATLNVDQARFSGNVATYGGGLYMHLGYGQIDNATFDANLASSDGGALHQASGDLTLTQVTISGNTAGSSGGGLFAADRVRLAASTIAGNSAAVDGGGLAVSGVTTLLSNILEGNFDQGPDGNAFGKLTSAGFNLDSDGSAALTGAGDVSGVTAQLGALQDNGGFAVTHRPLTGSTAINAGAQQFVSTTDAAGVERDGIADMGAVESSPGTEGKLFWIDGDTIVRANADGSHQQAILTGLVTPQGLTVDISNQRVYWTDRNHDVMAANLDGSDISTVVTMVPEIMGISVDPLRNQLYIVQSAPLGAGGIWKVNTDGSSLQQIVTTAGHAPIDVEVDPIHGKIYWSDQSGIGTEQILRANLDGSDQEVIVDSHQISGPSGIDLDLRQNKIYWVDSDPAGDRMRYAFLDGTLLQSVKDNVGDAVAIDDAVSVTVKDGSGEVFWIEPVSNQITLESAGATTLVAKGSTGLVDIEYVSLDANQAPVADIGGTYNVIEGQSVSLDASASSDADGSIVSYEWDFNFDGATFDVDASGAIVSFSATGLDGPTTRRIGLRVTDNQGSASLTKSVVVVANGAPVAVDDVVATDEDTAIDIFPLLNDFDPAALDTLSLSTPLLSTMTSKLVSGPATRSVSIVGDTIRFNPGTDFNDLQAGDSENVVMTYQVRDDDGGVDSGTITITVFGKNDAPSLVDGASVSLPAINEDDRNAAGMSIASLLSDAGLGADDADAGTVLGVAVTAADDAHGDWQFSRDAGVTWTNFGSVSSSSATLLDDNAQVRFVPQAEYSGPAGALRFRAWDQSLGASGDQGVDLTSASADGAFSQETAEATLNVLPVNDAPLAQADSLVTQEDAPIRITKSMLLANDVDVDGDTLTLTIDIPPGQGTWIDNGDDSFTFTPTRHFHGLTTLTYRVTDPDGLSHTATATITVVPENDRPTAVDDFFATQEDVSLNFDPTQLMSNDADVDGDPLNLTLLSQPDKGLVTTNLDGSFTFTPFANAEGVTSFQYRITDTDGLSATATVQITIQPLNDAPQTADDTYGVLEDGTLLGASVLANDFDIDGDPLTAELVAGPAAGTLTLRADGTFTYVHAGGEAASDSFRYQARDTSGVTTQAQVTIQVTNVNDQPLAMDDHFQVAEGDRHVAAGTLGALANDVDPDSPTLSGLVKTGPRHGTLNWNADGTFVYVHDGSETLSDSFTYTVSDGSSGTDEGVVQIDVTPVNDAPVATNDSLSVAANTGEIVFLSSELLGNDYDAEGQATQIVLLEAPLHGTVTLQPDGNISYQADVNFSGVDSFRYAISDGEAQSSPATVAVVVTPALPARNTVTPIVTTTTTTTTVVRAPSATIETAVTAVDAEPSLTFSASPAAPTQPSSTSTPASTSSIPTTTSASDTAAPQTPFPSILPFSQAESEDDDEAMFFGAEASRKSEDIVTVEQLREVITAANEIVPAPAVTRGNLPVQASAPQSGQPAGQYQPRTLPNEQLALASEAQFLRVASSFEASIIQSTEAMRDELPYTTTSVIDECAFAATSTFSVGYVLWMLRGGYLFATVISSMPAWQNFDPVPIMAYANVGRDGEDESLETLMEKSPPTT